MRVRLNLPPRPFCPHPGLVGSRSKSVRIVRCAWHLRRASGELRVRQRVVGLLDSLQLD
jgi:hypothetical protein